MGASVESQRLKTMTISLTDPYLNSSTSSYQNSGTACTSSRWLLRIAVSVGLAIILGVTVTGCSTATLTSGSNLAKVGQTAALQMEQNVTLSGNSLLALRKAVAFDDGFNNRIGNSNSAAVIANVTEIQAKLTQYGNWLETLASCYSALGDLAAYDAAGNFNSSIDALAKDTSSLASAVGKAIAIPPEATAGVKVAGGLVLGSIQAREVKKASHRIEALLTNTIAILNLPTTRTQMVGIQKEVIGLTGQAAGVLFDEWLYSYSPLLNDLGAPLGLAPLSKADSIVATNAAVKRGLNNVTLELLNSQVAATATSYDKSLNALKALVPLHENLRHGVPVDLTQINYIITQLRSIAAMFQTTKQR